jgi:hypothetical protein
VLVVVPAVSGSYDLGVVAVRAALSIDPRTARASIVSDPIPSILDGVPTRVRSVQAVIDRDRFTLNPTDCDPFSVLSSSTGDQGAVAGGEALFQVANCAFLDFGPKLAMRLSGGLNRRGHPSLRADLRMGPGEANIRRAVVTLSDNELLDSRNIKDVCTRVRSAADDCPAGSIYGWAAVTTPLLDAPLSGPVYLRTSDNELPDVVADLEGQIDVELVGEVDSVRGALRTSFHAVPDAPLSRFVFQLKGGRGGLLQNKSSVCAERQFARVNLVGQNGRRLNKKVRLRAGCDKGSERGRRHSKAGR